MGLAPVLLNLALGPVALLVGRVLFANRAALLAAELSTTANLALSILLAAPRLALSLLAALPLIAALPLACLAAPPLRPVLLAAPRMRLLDLLAAPLLSAPVLAALRLGPSALLQAVPVSAGLRPRIPQLALHALLLSSVLLPALWYVTVLLLATLLRGRPFQTALCATAGPSLLPSASLALLLVISLALPLSPSSILPSLALLSVTPLALPSLSSLAVALLALPLATLLSSPLTSLPFVRLLALSSALIGIVLVGRLATTLAVPLPRGLELPAALGAPSPSLTLALELGLSTLLGLGRVFAAAFSALGLIVSFVLAASIVLVAPSASVLPFVLSATVLGATVSVAHGNRSLDRHPANDAARELPKSTEDDPVGTSPVLRLNAANRSRGRRSNARVTATKGLVTSPARSRAGQTITPAGIRADHRD